MYCGRGTAYQEHSVIYRRADRRVIRVEAEAKAILAQDMRIDIIGYTIDSIGYKEVLDKAE